MELFTTRQLVLTHPLKPVQRGWSRKTLALTSEGDEEGERQGWGSRGKESTSMIVLHLF